MRVGTTAAALTLALLAVVGAGCRGGDGNGSRGGSVSGGPAGGGTVGAGDDRTAPTAQAAAPARPGRASGGSAIVTQLDSVLAEQGIRLNDAGRLERHPAAGFEVFWPSGCGKLVVHEPDEVDPDARQEFHYACDQFGKKGRGCSVYVLQNGGDPGGGPASPTTVVKQVESSLEKYGVRVERQRPLQANGIEGVEVQAVEPAGKGEVWIRGLLIGPHIFILTAWDDDGGLFSDPEVADFFASFKLIG